MDPISQFNAERSVDENNTINDYPKVSVGMPVYNGEKYISMAIESLLSQDYVNFELIISDNNSTDLTSKICKEYAEKDTRIKLIINPENIGMGNNFQKVLDLSTSEYFMWAAHDDLWDSKYISKCMAGLKENPQAIMCCSETVFINPDNSIKYEWKYVNIESINKKIPERIHEIISRVGWNAIYGVFKKKYLHMVNLTSNRYGNDVLLLVELSLLGEFVKVKEPLFYNRIPSKLKTTKDYINELNAPPKEYNDLQKPFTLLLHDIWQIVNNSNLSQTEKSFVYEDIIRTIGDQNYDWFGRLFWENLFPKAETNNISSNDIDTVSIGKLASSKMSVEQKRFFFDSILKTEVKDINAIYEVNNSKINSLQSDKKYYYSLNNSVRKKVLFFFPHNPFPVKTGAHKYALEILKGFKKLGCDVALFSSDIFTDNVWSEESEKKLKNELGVDSIIYLGTPDDRHYVDIKSHQNNLINWDSYLPPGLLNSFDEFYKDYRPDVIFINYSLWGNMIVKNDLGALTVLETHDLVSLNVKLSEGALLTKLNIDNPIKTLEEIDDTILKEDFFDNVKLSPDEHELKICDQFDFTLAVSDKETEIIDNNTQNTCTLHMPITIITRPLENNYNGIPLFVISDNPFNVQGYLYFAKNVLPEILKRRRDFKINVIGEGCKKTPSVVNINLMGYVDDLSAYYNKTPFAICPLIGGTGQQVKIVEAMAHGVPVIALENVGKNSPIIHGINGYMAKDFKEFAYYCFLLYEDRSLCKKLGEAAYDTIKEKYSEKSLLATLNRILEKASVKSKRIVTNVNEY